jgi:hypothetical protein
MKPELAVDQLKSTKLWELVLRFVFGGTITVGAGLIANRWGPAVAGLFLAFPAILPATITLVKRHGGRAEAIDDARGARLGSVGLAAFAIVVALLAGRIPAPLLLAFAALAWLAVDVGLWFAVYRRRATAG